MECPRCKGPMERGTAPFSVYRHGYQVHWGAIPAWICAPCAETFFGAREVAQIHQALAALDHANGRLAPAV